MKPAASLKVERFSHPESAGRGWDAPRSFRYCRQLAHELYDALVGGHYGFWDHIHELFLSRDMTRHDLRQLVRRGLTTTRGNYRAMLALFGIPESQYKRFMNFLATHECVVDFREFRGGSSDHDALPPTAGPPRPAKAASRSRSAEPAA